MPVDDIHLQGYAELSRKFAALGKAVGGKALRSAMVKSTSKVLREMKAKAPVGNEAHRTYKKRLVAPGFGRQSIRRISKVRNDGVSIRFGVKREAFYMIQFLDSRPGRTPYQVTQRRINTKRGRRKIKVRPYTIGSRPWFSSVFEKHADQMAKDLGKHSAAILEGVAKR